MMSIKLKEMKESLCQLLLSMEFLTFLNCTLRKKLCVEKLSSLYPPPFQKSKIPEVTF